MNRQTIVESTIINTHLSRNMKKLKLLNNMRLNKYASIEFNKWLIDLGNGTNNKIANLPIDSVEIPKFITVTNNLVETIFGIDIIHCEIISGNYKGTEVAVTKMDLTTTDNEWPFKFTRRQFPLFLGFAITINKSLGQTFNKVGIYLHKPVFSYGQLYVAFSRAQSEKQLP